MKTIADIHPFLDQVHRWAVDQADIQAIALVGSYARDKASASSDIDLVMLVQEPGIYLADTHWINRFGDPKKMQVEDYGKVTSLRVWYRQGSEMEFGITTPDWAASPLDDGTDRVIMDGIKVLYEREPVVSPVLDRFSQAEGLYADLVKLFRQYANPALAAKNQKWYKNEDYQSYGLGENGYKAVDLLLRHEIRGLPLRGRLHLARWLVLSNLAEEADFANTILARSVKELSPVNFSYLDEHLNHFHSWAQTDSFCIDVLQPLLWQYPDQTLALLRTWNVSENLWKRRASVVAFVRKVGASGKYTQPALEMCENLLDAPEDLVQKGVGWALKDTMRGDKGRVLEYIKSLRRRGVPATITLYAIRDLKGAERQVVLDIKPGQKPSPLPLSNRESGKG